MRTGSMFGAVTALALVVALPAHAQILNNLLSGGAQGLQQNNAYRNQMIQSGRAVQVPPQNAQAIEEQNDRIRAQNEQIRLNNQAVKEGRAPPVQVASPSPQNVAASAPQNVAVETGKVPQVADDFYADKIKAIAKYSEGAVSEITFYGANFQDGKFVVGWRETPTPVLRVQQQQQAQQDTHFDWATWFAQAQNNDYLDNVRWTIICRFPPSDGAELQKLSPKGGARMANMKLVAANDRQLTFDCHF